MKNRYSVKKKQYFSFIKSDKDCLLTEMKPVLHPISFYLGFSQESHTVSISESFIDTSIYIYDFAEEIAEFPPTYCRVKFPGSLI